MNFGGFIMGRFDEKIMLVTGATSGIGRAVAIRAAKEGATVVAVGRNEERGAAVVAAMEEAGGKGEFMKCDVSNKDAVKALFAEIQEKYGKLDVAVNNAGIVGDSKTVEELEDDDWFQVIDANLNSCFFCCREDRGLRNAAPPASAPNGRRAPDSGCHPVAVGPAERGFRAAGLRRWPGPAWRGGCPEHRPQGVPH